MSPFTLREVRNRRLRYQLAHYSDKAVQSGGDRGRGGGTRCQLGGNDNSSFIDAYNLGGVPWEAEANYNAEAAIWQIGKVTTPTHIVGGSEDTNVPVIEDYLLERALHTRGIPSSLLIFPGEGHGLDRNPWHGKIKVREELKWLEKYGRKSP